MTSPSPVKTYNNKPGFTELRYRVGTTIHREVVPDEHVHGRKTAIEDDLKRFQVPLSEREIVEFRAAQALLPEGVTILDVVKQYRETTAASALHTWSHLIEEFISEEILRGLDNNTVRDKKSKLQSATDTFPMKPTQVLASHISKFLASIQNAKTSNNFRSTLVQFFDWMMARNHYPATTNPVRLSRPRRIAAKDPVPTSPQDLRVLLAAADRLRLPDAILLIAIGAFAGLRQAEILRLRKENLVRNEAGIPTHIVLSSEITKTSKRRVVDVTPQLAIWIHRAESMQSKFYAGPLRDRLVKVSNPNRMLRTVADIAAVEWTDNGLRKGFVSATATKHWIDHAAKQAGHSVDVSESNYKALFDVHQANLWFSIIPEELT